MAMLRSLAPSRRWVPPLLDSACIVVFVTIGRDRHAIEEGLSWWGMVLWPLFLGWFAVALATRLYTRTGGPDLWIRLALTLVGGLAVMSLLRGTFTPRPYVGIFTIVAFGFLGLTTFGWRVVAAFLRSRRSGPGIATAGAPD